MQLGPALFDTLLHGSHITSARKAISTDVPITCPYMSLSPLCVLEGNWSADIRTLEEDPWGLFSHRRSVGGGTSPHSNHLLPYLPGAVETGTRCPTIYLIPSRFLGCSRACALGLMASLDLCLSAERAGSVPRDWSHLPLCQAVRGGPYNVHSGNAWHHDQAPPLSHRQADPHLCNCCHGIPYARVSLQWVRSKRRRCCCDNVCLCWMFRVG